MKVVLEPFARSSIEGRFGADVDRGAQAALRHYTRRVRSRRRPPDVPAFMREADIDRVQGTEIDLPVSYEVQAALNRESRLQGVSLDLIVAHAIYVYLGDMEIFAEGDRDGAEEGGAEPRYQLHVPRHPTSPVRQRGTAGAGGTLRGRSRGTRGRSRFGKR